MVDGLAHYAKSSHGQNAPRGTRCRRSGNSKRRFLIFLDLFRTEHSGPAASDFGKDVWRLGSEEVRIHRHGTGEMEAARRQTRRSGGRALGVSAALGDVQ